MELFGAIILNFETGWAAFASASTERASFNSLIMKVRTADLHIFAPGEPGATYARVQVPKERELAAPIRVATLARLCGNKGHIIRSSAR